MRDDILDFMEGELREGVKLQQASRKLADEIIFIMEKIGPPMGVRQMFYQCVVRELVPNSRSGYRKVQRLLDLMRDSGEVDEEAIVDRSRPVLEASVWENATDFIKADAYSYRKDLWATQEERVEVWHRIVVWGKQGETCAEVLKKGRQVCVEGKLRTRDWTNKAGVKQQTTEIVADHVTFLGGK